MKNRYFIQLSYKGTDYVGWQFQPNGISVQESLEKALSTILREPISVTGCGRTDAGVHAKYFIAHFDSENKQVPEEKTIYTINNFLDKDIAIQKIYLVNPDSHARFDAISRSYEYWISKIKDPFSQDLAAFSNRELNIDEMNNAAQLLFNYIDFTSFSKLHTDVKTNNCIIKEAKWLEQNGMLIFRITADRFLRNMVRAIVGTLLEVGQGKMDVEGFRTVIEAKDRGKAGASVPAKGLYLTDVVYIQ